MNSPFDFFDKIYCINLAERTDRWEQCLKNFEKYDIKNYERVDGIRINGDLPQKRKGQIGCSLSYASSINKAIQNKYNNVLILEDDFKFLLNKADLHLKINSAISELPADWDGLYFGGNVTSDYGRIPIKKYSKNLLKLDSAHTTHCIAFSKNGLIKIIDFFKQNPTTWELQLVNNYICIDTFFAQDYQHINNVYITSELLCYQEESKSDIENTTYDYSQWMNKNFNFFKSII